MALAINSVVDIELEFPDGTTSGDHGTVLTVATGYLEITGSNQSATALSVAYPWESIKTILVTG